MTPEEIKTLRFSFFMTTKQWAALLGVTKNCVEYWESGARGIPAPAQLLFILLKNDPKLMQVLKGLKNGPKN